MLQLRRDAEISKDHEEDEKIVDAERKLDQVPGGKLQAGRSPMPEVNQNGKAGRESDPHCAPAHGFPKIDRMRPAIEHAQIERQHREHENIKQDPEEQHS